MSRRSSRGRRAAGRGRPWWVVAPWVLAAVVAALAVASLGRLGSRDTPPALAPERRAALAPDLTLTTLQGEYQLAGQRGEVVALYFSFVG